MGTEVAIDAVLIMVGDPLEWLTLLMEQKKDM